MGTGVRHLFLKRNGYYAEMAVPKELTEIIGKKKMSRSLGTGDKAVARRRLNAVVAEFQDQIEAARKEVGTSDEWMAAFAARWRKRYADAEALSKLTPHGDYSPLDQAADELSEELDTLFSERMSDDAPKVEPQVEALKARIFGNYVGLKETADAWLKETKATLKPSTYAAREQHLRVLFEQIDPNSNMRAVSRRQAGTLIAALVQKELTAKTITTGYITTYHTFWAWAASRGYLDLEDGGIPPNIWKGHQVRSAKTSIRRRPWRPAELLALLKIDWSSSRRYGLMMPDLVRLALLTGCRIEELCDARVEHIRGLETRHDDRPLLTLYIPKGKTAAAERDIPIHPAAVPIVLARVDAASRPTLVSSEQGWLFGGLKPGGKGSSRSHQPSKVFGSKIREVGFDDPGLTFHSLRHSFTTALQGAGVQEYITDLLTGHKVTTMSYGRYADGSMIDFRKTIDALDFGQEVMKALGIVAEGPAA